MSDPYADDAPEGRIQLGFLRQLWPFARPYRRGFAACLGILFASFALELIGPWVLLIAFLMISNVATFSWSSLRLRKNIRLEALAIVALTAASLLTVPWITLSAISIVYLTLIPFGIRSYAKVRQQRANQAG